MRVVGLVLLASSLAQAASIIDEVPDVVEDGDTEEIYAEASRPAGDAMFGEMGGEAYDLGDMGGWDMGMDGYGEQDGQLIHALFSALDANQDDWLSPSELKEGLRKQQSQYIEQVEHAQHTEARRAHQRADRSGDAAVSADEFAEASHGLLFMPHVEAAVPKPRLFAFADADADGSLSEDELRALMFADTGPRHRELQSLVAEATMDAHDADRSGLLDTAELRRFLEAQADGEEPSPWHDHDEAAAVEGSAAEMEEADSSGDRLLDRAELGEYLVPHSAEPGPQVVSEQFARLSEFADARGGFDMQAVHKAADHFFEACRRRTLAPVDLAEAASHGRTMTSAKLTSNGGHFLQAFSQLIRLLLQGGEVGAFPDVSLDDMFGPDGGEDEEVAEQADAKEL